MSRLTMAFAVRCPAGGNWLDHRLAVSFAGIARIKRIFSEIYTYRTTIAGPLPTNPSPLRRQLLLDAPVFTSCTPILGLNPIVSPPLPQRAQQIR